MTLRKGLTRLEGVADAKLIIKPPHMQVRMKPGYWPDLPKMHTTIRDAGYTPMPDRTGLVVSGKLVQLGGRLVLEVDHLKSSATLAIVATKEKPELTAVLEKRQGEVIVLEGLWTAPAEGMALATLTVTAVSEVDDKKPGK